MSRNPTIRFMVWRNFALMHSTSVKSQPSINHLRAYLSMGVKANSVKTFISHLLSILVQAMRSVLMARVILALVVFGVTACAERLVSPAQDSAASATEILNNATAITNVTVIDAVNGVRPATPGSNIPPPSITTASDELPLNHIYHIGRTP